MSFDRIKAHLESIVLKMVGERVKFLGLYPATVVQQNADFTLELVPEDSAVAKHSKVRIRHGVPGLKVKVPTGSKVLLGFSGGDPRLPYAALWEASALELVVEASTKVTVKAPSVLLGDGTAAVARVGDAVAPTAMMGTWITQVSTALNTLAPGSAVPPTDGFGKVAAGSPKVKA